MDNKTNFEPMTAYRNVRTKLFIDLLSVCFLLFIATYVIDSSHAASFLGMITGLIIMLILSLDNKFIVDTDRRQILLKSKFARYSKFVNFDDIQGYRLYQNEIAIVDKSDNKYMINPSQEIQNQVIRWLDSQNFPDLNYQEALKKSLIDANGEKLSVTDFNDKLNDARSLAYVFLVVILVTSIFITINQFAKIAIILLVVEIIVCIVMTNLSNGYWRYYEKNSSYPMMMVVFMPLTLLVFANEYVKGYSPLLLICTGVCSIVLALIIITSTKTIEIMSREGLKMIVITLVTTTVFSYILFKYINMSYDKSTPQVLYTKFIDGYYCDEKLLNRGKCFKVSGYYNLGDNVKITYGSGLLGAKWYKVN